MILIEDHIIHKISEVLKANSQYNSVLIEEAPTGISVIYVDLPDLRSTDD